MPRMAKIKEGDRVEVVTRDLTSQDAKVHAFFGHLFGLKGTVQSVYGPEEVAIKVDLESLTPEARAVHSEATRRMRAKFIENTGEEARKPFTKEELDFTPNFVILVKETDLAKI